jgi:hypothetical protein
MRLQDVVGKAGSATEGRKRCKAKEHKTSFRTAILFNEGPAAPTMNLVGGIGRRPTCQIRPRPNFGLLDASGS